MLVTASGALPTFFRVVAWAALVVPTICAAKASELGVRLTAGAVPVPLSGRLCGLPAASSTIDTLAFRIPAAVGPKVIEIVPDLPKSAAGKILRAEAAKLLRTRST